MKKTVYMSDFFEAFDKHERLNQFPNTLAILFDYLEEYEASTGDEMELDVIGLCCDFTEWSSEDLAEEFDASIQTVEKIIAEHFDNVATRAKDGKLYTILSEADFVDLRMYVEEEEEESDDDKREAIAEALEDLAKNITAIARDVEDDTRPITELLEDLESDIDDFIHDYNQDVEEFKD